MRDILNSLLSLRVGAQTNRYKVMQKHCINKLPYELFRATCDPSMERSPTSIVNISSFTRFKLSLNNVNLRTILVFNCMF